MTQSRKTVQYHSQCELSCGSDVDYACGPISVCNFMALKCIPVTPAAIFACIESPPLSDRKGLAPEELERLCQLMLKGPGRKLQCTATLRRKCNMDDLHPGDLMYISSVALLNAQGGNQYEEDSDWDSHIVMVETIDHGAAVITVINPDCRKCGRGFVFS